MSTEVADRAVVERRLRLSLLSAFQMDPLLVPEEKLLHGPLDPSVGVELQARALALLHAGPTIAEAERTALLPLGPEAWEQARTLVQSHFDSPTAIPDQDLAVYAPVEQKPEDRSRRELLEQVEQIARLAGEPEIGFERDIETAAEEALQEKELSRGLDRTTLIQERSHFEPQEVDPSLPAEEILKAGLPPVEGQAVEWDLSAVMDPRRLTPLPLVIAALEAIGLDEDQYGFLLRYGSFAPTGRKSEIKIGGLGLAQFSLRAAEWFNALGATKFPVQVIDEGSGELTIYLLESGPA